MKPRSLTLFWLLWISAACSLIPAVFYPDSWPLWVGINFMLVGLIAIGTFLPNCGWFGPVVSEFSTPLKEVWLTLDDGPDEIYTRKTLDLLRRYDATATFFVVGRKVQAHPELAIAILESGHSLGNHSATHPAAYFWALPQSAAGREIDACNQAIRSATGFSPAWFRAPVAMANCFVRNAVRQRGMLLIGYSCRGFDGLQASPEEVVRKLFRMVRPGAILMLHESSSTQPLRDNLAVLEAVLARLKAEGYRCVIPRLEEPPSQRSAAV